MLQNADSLSGRSLMTSTGHTHRSFNNITGNWVTEVHVTPIWWYTVANWKFLNPMLFHEEIFCFNFEMTFEVNNCAIWTWNVILVSECCFVSENVIFVSEIYILVVEVVRFEEFTVSLWNFAIWFHKMSFLSQKAISISESGLYFKI